MTTSFFQKLLGVVVLAATLTSGNVLAQSVPADAATTETMHKGLRDLKATMQRALSEMDLNTLLANVTEDVVFTTMNGDVALGREGIKKYFDTMMKGPKRVVSSINANFEADDLSHLYGSDVAVAWGSSKDRYQMAVGGALDVNARWSGTMVRRDGKWLIANFHYSTNMFDNPALDSQRKIFSIAGLVGGLALAIAAFWLGSVRGRRRQK
jgi:uncharacterized protein (TIGR02246 family)